MDNILEISDLHKSYKNFSLQDVSFTLPEGCITGFIGANGAGKTTTIKTMLGLTGKFSGTVRFFGMDMAADEQKIKERIGVVLDDGCFYDELTLQLARILLLYWLYFPYGFLSKQPILPVKVRRYSLLPFP